MTITYVDTAAGQFVVEARGGLEIASGDPTGLRLASEHLHFFHPDGAAI